MIMNVKARGATRRVSGLVRLLAGRNALRRPVDRIEGAVLAALSAALAVAGGAGIALLISYALCRLVLDRRRLTAWESAWSLTGPRWTTRR